MIPKPFIQDVVTRTDIVAIIAARIELKKRGNTHSACCPFHHEKTPSFTVSQSKQFYYCFGCGAHGNVIGFLMAYDHLTFVDVITDLAQQLGLTIPNEIDNTNAAQNDGLYTVLRDAQSQFEQQLKIADQAIVYLKKRGLTGQTAKRFSVGFAPDAWDFLAKSSKNLTTLAQAGMLIEKESGKYYDRFRNRVVFPIRDHRGRTVGFGGRTLTNETPKYLNSPETPIFHKHQTLYGLYETCQQHRTLKRAIVVEGYLDVISLAQHGIDYAVATLGTALNVKHIQLLLRYTNDVIFCFDGDAAGQKAAMKALTISLPLLRDGLHFRFLFLKDKEDPDSLIQKIGHDAFEKLVDGATALSDVFFDELTKTHDINTIAGKAAFAKAANELIQTMPAGIYQNLLLDHVAKKLSLTRDRLAITSPTEKAPLTKIAPRTRRPQHTRLNPASIAIQLLLQDPTLAQLSPCTLSDSEKSIEKVQLMELLQRCRATPDITVSELLTEITDESMRADIAMIATQPTHIPENGRKAEFLGALARLQEQEQAHELSCLIDKAKQLSISDEERKGPLIAARTKTRDKNAGGNLSRALEYSIYF